MIIESEICVFFDPYIARGTLSLREHAIFYNKNICIAILNVAWTTLSRTFAGDCSSFSIILTKWSALFNCLINIISYPDFLSSHFRTNFLTTSAAIASLWFIMSLRSICYSSAHTSAFDVLANSHSSSGGKCQKEPCYCAH